MARGPIMLVTETFVTVFAIFCSLATVIPKLLAVPFLRMDIMDISVSFGTSGYRGPVITTPIVRPWACYLNPPSLSHLLSQWDNNSTSKDNGENRMKEPEKHLKYCLSQ